MTDAEIIKLWLNTPDQEGASGYQDIISFARAFEAAIHAEIAERRKSAAIQAETIDRALRYRSGSC